MLVNKAAAALRKLLMDSTRGHVVVKNLNRWDQTAARRSIKGWSPSDAEQYL